MSCLVEGCAKQPQSRGWCGAHYMRWKRHGDPTAGLVPAGTESERFWSKASLPRGSFGCMEWLGALSTNGYGQFWWNARMGAAHRWSFQASGGIVPDDMELDHLCANRRCVRPDHLEPVTHAENLLRRGNSRVVPSGEGA